MSDPYVPVVPPTGETLNGTYGAMLIGVLVAAILFGATNVQVYMYAIHNPHDSIWNKLVVGALWILDAVHTALCFHLVYWYLITNYYRPPELLDIVWSFKAQIIVVAILIIFVHTLYVLRIWKLDIMVHSATPWTRRLIPIFVSVCLLTGYVAGIVLCYEIVKFTKFAQMFQPDREWVVFYSLGTAASLDAIIAVCVFRLLTVCRTGFLSIDFSLTWLMQYALHTGVITLLCSLTCIMMMAALPYTFAIISVNFCLPKLYVNSFMAMFNARRSLRATGPRTTQSYALRSSEPWASTTSHGEQKSAFSRSNHSHGNISSLGHGPRSPMRGYFNGNSAQTSGSDFRLGRGPPSPRMPPEVHVRRVITTTAAGNSITYEGVTASSTELAEDSKMESV